MNDNEFVLDLSKNENRPKISCDQLTEEDIKLMTENIHDLSEQMRESFQSSLNSLIEAMTDIHKQTLESMSESAKMFADSMSHMSEQMINSLKESLANSLESLAVSMNEIQIPETVISEIMNSPEIIDSALPILDEFEIPEPQREAIVEYKKSGKISAKAIGEIILTIVAILEFLLHVYECFKPDEPTTQIVINIDADSADDITQYIDNDIEQITTAKE